MDNRIPWRHPGDLKRFKRITLGSTVIMGRHTYESIGKPLAGRRNLVVTRQNISGVDCARSLDEAFAQSSGDVWIIGGAQLYAEAIGQVGVIDVTYVPDRIEAAHAIYFPPIDEQLFSPGPLLPHEDEPGLFRRVYSRRA